MAITLIFIFLFVGLAAGAAWMISQRIKLNREARISENEFNAASNLREYAARVKPKTDAVMRGRAVGIDFNTVTIPQSTGYRTSVELHVAGFRIYAVPVRYDRTGRLSFYVDNRMSIRAFDHAGEMAGDADPVYINAG